MRWLTPLLATLLLCVASEARQYRPAEIVHASWTSTLPTSTWVELHLPHCPQFGHSGKFDFYLRKDHYVPAMRLAFGFEKHKFITPFIATTMESLHLVRVDITLLSNGKELVGVAHNAHYGPPAGAATPRGRSAKQQKTAPPAAEEAKGEGQEEDGDALPWSDLFPEDDDEAVRDDASPELAREGDNEANAEPVEAGAEAPQEAEGEQDAAEADEGVIQVFYHWDSEPSDDLENGVAYAQAVALVALIAHSIYLIYKNWRARSSAPTSAPQPASPVAARPVAGSGLGFAPSSPLPPSTAPPPVSIDKEGKAA